MPFPGENYRSGMVATDARRWNCRPGPEVNFHLSYSLNADDSVGSEVRGGLTE